MRAWGLSQSLRRRWPAFAGALAPAGLAVVVALVAVLAVELEVFGEQSAVVGDFDLLAVPLAGSGALQAGGGGLRGWLNVASVVGDGEFNDVFILGDKTEFAALVGLGARALRARRGGEPVVPARALVDDVGNVSAVEGALHMVMASGVSGDLKTKRVLGVFEETAVGVELELLAASGRFASAILALVPAGQIPAADVVVVVVLAVVASVNRNLSVNRGHLAHVAEGVVVATSSGASSAGGVDAHGDACNARALVVVEFPVIGDLLVATGVAKEVATERDLRFHEAVLDTLSAVQSTDIERAIATATAFSVQTTCVVASADVPVDNR